MGKGKIAKSIIERAKKYAMLRFGNGKTRDSKNSLLCYTNYWHVYLFSKDLNIIILVRSYYYLYKFISSITGNMNSNQYFKGM
jgi:hypothetical protein